MKHGTIVALSVSKRKGMRKANVPAAVFIEQWGIEGDAHAADWHRQVSLLAIESIRTMQAKGLTVGPGDFAENVTTEWIDLPHLQIGERIQLGAVLLEITQIGKECHTRCAIYRQAGDCVMPREGVFARVLRGGVVTVGEAVLRERGDQPAEHRDAPAP